MLLTKQQKFLLAALDSLGCVRIHQLSALLQQAFGFSSFTDASRITEACVRQMQYGGLLRIQDGVLSRDAHPPDLRHLESIDVMLELSQAELSDYRVENTKILLRFSLSDSGKRFAIVSGSDPPPEYELRQEEKIIVLLTSGCKPEQISYTRPIIFAIRQEDGTHRFFARK